MGEDKKYDERDFLFSLGNLKSCPEFCSKSEMTEKSFFRGLFWTFLWTFVCIFLLENLKSNPELYSKVKSDPQKFFRDKFFGDFLGLGGLFGTFLFLPR